MNGLTSRTGLMELLIRTLNKGKSVHMKFIAVINKKGVVDFKLFKINLNCLLIDGASIFSSKQELTSSDFLRFFTNPRDAAFFNTYVPYNKLQILNMLNKEKDEATQEGRYTDAMVMEAIYGMVEGNKQKVIVNATVLANRALFISRLGEKYDLLYQLTYIIQAGSSSNSVSWRELEIPVVNKYFDDFYVQMVGLFYSSANLSPTTRVFTWTVC